MSSSRSAKEIVGEWMAIGMCTPAGLELVTDDFVWFGPPSMGELFEDTEGAAQRGKEGLARLEYIDRAVYTDFEPGDMAEKTNVHFLIGEGDTAVMQFDAKFTTHEGVDYHNVYCLVVRVRDGLVAEVREHADTHYFWKTQLDTEEKRASIHKRLAELRA